MVHTVGQRMWNSPIKLQPKKSVTVSSGSWEEKWEIDIKALSGGNLHTTPITENEF